AVRRPPHLPADSSEPVDAYPYCHSLSSIWLKPVSACMSPAKSHVTDDPRAGAVQHLCALVERCPGRDDVIYQHDVRTLERGELSAADFERACNVALPLFGCRPRLGAGLSRATSPAAAAGSPTPPR